GDVDPDGSPIDADVTSVVTQPSPVRAADTAIAPGGGGKVLGVLAGLEGDHVGAEEAFHDRGSPWEPGVELDGRERDVAEEADPDVESDAPEHGRNQLGRVVVHPDGVTGLGNGSGLLGKPTVHGDVGGPPGPMTLGRAHPVVIEGSEGAVA